MILDSNNFFFFENQSNNLLDSNKKQILTKKLVTYMSKYCTIHTILWYNSYNMYFCIIRFMSTSNTSLCYGSFCNRYNTYSVAYHIDKWQLWTHIFRGVHKSSLCLTCNRPDLIGSKKIQPTVHRKWGSNWVVRSLIEWQTVQSALETEMEKMKMTKI